MIDIGWNMDRVVYIDCATNVSVQNYMIGQANLDELLVQYEEYSLEPDEIEILSYLVGKQYQSCEIWELVDLVDVEGEDVTLPYFCVSIDGGTYDSRSMGNGEHFYFSCFGVLRKL